ncbi:MAG TPA: PAS domain S-box protein, partial [Vicinamibacterales bacterium]|nr:PAS domain S-box protein [Vicinamibacterales bacterium]
MDDRHTHCCFDVPDRDLNDVQCWFAAIVDSSNDAVISKSLDGVISTWNAAAQRLFGYSPEEAIGQPITIIIPPELHDEETHILNRLRTGERIENYETRRVTRDGRYLDVSLTISPVTDARGNILGASKILRDVTESKRTHMALRESEQHLANEIAGARTLQAISTRLISESTQESLFTQIVDAAIELMSADAGSIQMLAPDGQSLTLLGCKNFHVKSAVFWQRATAEASSTCSRALRSGQRVLVPDVEKCDFLVGTQDLDELRRSGIRAVQSTPL